MAAEVLDFENPILEAATAESLRRLPARQVKGARLGTTLRGKLADAYGARGHHRSNLWYVYSPKSKSDVVLRSNLEFLHFLLVESHPDIVEVDYAPKKQVASLSGEAFGTIVDAVCKLRSGAIIWREVKYAKDVEHGAQTRANLQLMTQLKASGLAGVTHEVVTEDQIYGRAQRLHNWMRIIPWIAQCRHLPLHNYTKAVLKIMKTRGDVVLADIAALGLESETGLYCAALFQAVQQGLILSDLDAMPVTWQSRFFLREVL